MVVENDLFVLVQDKECFAHRVVVNYTAGKCQFFKITAYFKERNKEKKQLETKKRNKVKQRNAQSEINV